jgi:hypothetical protein
VNEEKALIGGWRSQKDNFTPLVIAMALPGRHCFLLVPYPPQGLCSALDVPIFSAFPPLFALDYRTVYLMVGGMVLERWYICGYSWQDEKVADEEARPVGIREVGHNSSHCAQIQMLMRPRPLHR